MIIILFQYVRGQKKPGILGIVFAQAEAGQLKHGMQAS
jgi:hypothetical protein